MWGGGGWDEGYEGGDDASDAMALSMLGQYLQGLGAMKGAGKMGGKMGGMMGGMGGMEQMQQMMQMQMMMQAKGFAKGFGKGGKGDKASGRRMPAMVRTAAAQKCHVKGLPEGCTYKMLEIHFAGLGPKPTCVEVSPKGTGCVAFDSAEEAELAITNVNASELSGAILEVNPWSQEAGAGAENTKKRGRGGVEFLPAGAAPVPKRGRRNETNEIDASLKVWVGDLKPQVSEEALRDHFKSKGCEPVLAFRFLKSGTACVTFVSEADVAHAVTACNATEIEGKTMQVNAWTCSPKTRPE